MPNKADGSVVIAVRADTGQASKDFAKMNKEIAQEEKKLEREVNKRDSISDGFERASYKANELEANLKKLKAELAQVNQTLNFHEYDIPTPSVEEVIQATEREKELKAEIAEQTKKFDAQVKLVNKLNDQLNKSETIVEKITNELTRQKTEAGKTAQNIKTGTVNTAAMDKQQKKVTNSVRRTNREHTKTPKLIQKGTQAIKRLGMRMVSLVASAFVFSVITKALTNLREHFSEVVKANDRTAGALARLKGALLTMAQPIVDFVIPRFETLLNVLTRVATVTAAVMAKLFGTTIEESAKAAESLQNQIEGVEGIGKAAQKSLASFDQLNIISTTQDSGGAAGGEIKPDFNITEDLTDKDMDRVDQIVERLKEIADFVKNDVNPSLETLKNTWKDINESFQEIPDFSGLKVAINMLSFPISSFTDLGIIVNSLIRIFAGFAKEIKGSASGIWDISNGTKDLTLGLISIPIDILTNMVDLFLSLAGIQIDASGWWAKIKQSLVDADLETFFKDNFNTPLSRLLNQFGIDTDTVFEGIEVGISGIGRNIPVIKERFASLSKSISERLSMAAENSRLAMEDFFTWLKSPEAQNAKDGFLNGFKTAFKTTWDEIVTAFKVKFTGIQVFARHLFNNGILPAIEGGINAIIDGINGLIGKINRVVIWGGDILGENWTGIKLLPRVTLPRIPELATGAVIPPNREFLAVLGDQRSGTNIETPEALLRQIMREEMNSGNGMPREISITIKAAAGLPRYLKYELDAETRRQGGKLVEGTV